MPDIDDFYSPNNLYGSFGLVMISCIFGIMFAYYNFREV